MTEDRNSEVSARFTQRLAFAAADAILDGQEVVWQERANGRPALGEPFGDSVFIRLLGRAIDEVHGPGPVSFFTPYDGTGRVEARRNGALLFEGLEPEFERGRLELRSRYVKLPANVVTDPMFAGLPDAAWRMHWEVACSCVLQLNNGRFQTQQIRFLTRVSPRERTIRALIDLGLWQQDGARHLVGAGDGVNHAVLRRGGMKTPLSAQLGEGGPAHPTGAERANPGHRRAPAGSGRRRRESDGADGASRSQRRERQEPTQKAGSGRSGRSDGSAEGRDRRRTEHLCVHLTKPGA